jgi:signal transduction histidine kinase
VPSFKVIVGVLFGLLISAIVVLGVISYEYNDQVITSAFWVNHTHQVIEAGSELSSASKDLISESNAVFIRGDTSRVPKYRNARTRLFALLEGIRNLTKDDSHQRANIDSLDILVHQLVSFVDSTTASAHSASEVYERVGDATDFRDRMDVVLEKIKKQESELLRIREAENSMSIASFNNAFSELLVGIVLLIVVAFFSIRSNFNRLMRIDEQLRHAQEKTERALAAEIELNKLKTNFVALASHEFRTPLTTVLSSAALLENYCSGEHVAKASRHIARIKSSVNSLTTILDEFLSITRIEEGRLHPNMERIDLKHYMDHCIGNLQNFAKPGQKIVYVHDGVVDVETDPVFIGNIVNNLVSNAIKYSPENSLIRVSSAVNSTIQLSVEDSGIGIPEEDQKHLFERFYRASNAGTIQGTGLGLHIMRHYVEMLNGTVQIKSAPGKGTRVEIVLARQ